MNRRAWRLTILGFGLLATVWLWPVLWPPAGQTVGGLDSRGQFFVWLQFAQEAVRNGRLPLWNSSLFAGYPFLSDPQVAFFYPLTWLLLPLPTGAALGWHIWLHLVVAGVGMVAWLRYERRHWLGAILAAVLFTFSGYTAVRIYAGHIGFLAASAWLPWLLLGLAWSVRRRSVWTAVVAGVPFGLAILAGNPTSLLYVGLIWLLVGLFYGTQMNADERRFDWAVMRQMGVMLGVGVLLAAVQLWPLLEFSRVSSRAAELSYAFSTAFSLPPAHLITLLVPEFFGEPTRVGYWSVPNFEELTYYAGVLPLLGLILALKRPSRRVWFWLGVMVLGLLLALGSYGFLFRWAYELIPVFRLTRAPARAAFLFSFGGAVLLAEAVTQWQALSDAERRDGLARLMRVLLPTIAVAGITAVAALGAVFMAVHPTDTSGRLWQQLGGWALATVLLLAGGGLLWGWLTAVSEQRRRWLGAALVALALIDLWTFGSKFVTLNATAPAGLWTDAAAIIGDAEGRVLPWGISIFDQNGAAQVGLDSVFGYNPLEIGANTAFAASVPDPRSAAYDVLGAEFVISQVALDQYTDGERPLTLVGEQNGARVYRRGRVLPLVRLVTAVEVIPDKAAATARVHAPDFDPATTAIVAEQPPCELGSGGTAVVTERADGFWQIATQSDAPALLVVSETAYPGWRVWVDDAPAEVLTAYTAVRSVCVPPGAHVVTWRYQPSVFWQGGLVSLLGLFLVLGALWRLRGAQVIR